MEKVEANNLIKAINNLSKTQQECNKQLERFVKTISDNNEVNKEIRTRLLTLSNSIDALANSMQNNS